MSVRRGIAVLIAVLAAAPAAHAAPPIVDVEAAGNPFTGGLAFKPAKVRVVVGQVVRWTNTDDSVPHTATENHFLWDLTGTYGLPGNYGFGPGESRQRAFEAGTQRYFCKVHPDTMRAVVEVPVKLSVQPKTADKPRRLVVRWSAKAPAAGQVYDVQLKRGAGEWKSFRKGTKKLSGKKARSGAKVTWRARARLRKANDASASTGWSPVAKIQA
jgi:plastocyanin